MNTRDDWKLIKDLPTKKGRYVVVDTETTGISAIDHLVDIAAVEVIDGKLTGVMFNAFVEPRKKIPKKSEKFPIDLSYIEENLDEYADRKDTMKTFSKFVGDSLIFCYNATFDYGMISRELKFWNLPEIPKSQYRCLMRIVKEIFKNKSDNEEALPNFKLETVCCHFRLKNDSKSFHTALYDSQMTAKLLCKVFMIGDYYLNNLSFSIDDRIDIVEEVKRKMKENEKTAKKDNLSILSNLEEKAKEDVPVMNETILLDKDVEDELIKLSEQFNETLYIEENTYESKHESIKMLSKNYLESLKK